MLLYLVDSWLFVHCICAPKINCKFYVPCVPFSAQRSPIPLPVSVRVVASLHLCLFVSSFLARLPTYLPVYLPACLLACLCGCTAFRRPCAPLAHKRIATCSRALNWFGGILAPLTSWSLRRDWCVCNDAGVHFRHYPNCQNHSVPCLYGAHAIIHPHLPPTSRAESVRLQR